MINVTFFALDAGYAATVAHWLLREAEGTACFSPQPFYPLPPLEHPYSLTEGDSLTDVFIPPSSSPGNRSKQTQ